MLKFGLLTVIDPLIRKLERTHPVLPGQPRLGRRRTYATWLLVRLWLLGVLGGWSERQLFLKLGNPRARAWLRRFLALPATLPDRTQFARRLREPDFLEALRLLFEELARRLARRRPADLATLSLDFTDLPVNVKHDPDAAYGYSSKGRFYGYSLHLVITRRGGALGLPPGHGQPSRRPPGRGDGAGPATPASADRLPLGRLQLRQRAVP